MQEIKSTKDPINNIHHREHENTTNNKIDKTDLELANFEEKHESHESTYVKNPKIRHAIKILLQILIHIVVVGYFAYATYHYNDITKHDCNWYPTPTLCGIQFCSGYGLLTLLVGFTYLALFYYYIFKPYIGRKLDHQILSPAMLKWHKFSRTRIVSAITLITVLLIFIVFIYFETHNEPQKLISLVAPSIFIVLGYICSTNRSAIQWRVVVTGVACQFLLGIICIRWEVGRKIFQCLGDKVATFLGFADSGSRFVFGNTIINEGVFAFAILPVIFFFSFFISCLYYLGIMQWVVMKMGWVLQSLLGTTVCESVVSAANIFLGMSESPLLIAPYMNKLTASEIHSIMVSGFATVSGTVLAAYLSFGASAAHLITSSVMAAPGALAISKLYLPETEESQITSETIQLEKSTYSSLLDAASTGASNAIPVILGIIANIVSFIAFITFLNAIVSWLGFLVGLDNIDFEWIFSKLFIPLSWAMGVPYTDCDAVAKVVATKTIINEFVAYEKLGGYIKNGTITSRSASITTYAICGFANPSSLGIIIGVLGVIAPNQRTTITAVAFRAFIVGSIVCFISASFAGILIQEDAERESYTKILTQLPPKNITIGFIQNS